MESGHCPFLTVGASCRMAPADLDTLLELVSDEESFGLFLHALATDFEADREMYKANPDKYSYSSGPLGWEDEKISHFLYGQLQFGVNQLHKMRGDQK